KELTREMMEDKTGILDVRAKTENGIQINIEVQLTNQHNMDKRTLFYWGRLFNENIAKGEDYKNLQKVITINILEFNYIELEKFHTKFHLWEDESKEYMLTDLVEIHFIEIPKFNKLEEKNLKEDKLQRWLTFFNKDISEDTLRELMDMDEDIRKVEERLEYLSSDKETISLYKAREKSLHERANMISSAKEEGREEGREESAIEALKLGLDVDIAAKISKLSVEKTKELKKRLLQ
ncbi:Rpn family recombination-promoting nuclease/putative transposase, partial [Lutibacter sp. B2]|nr:Rpn family recombination-promoting nuclease/putative transposase [Lutibacter sp. B2]